MSYNAPTVQVKIFNESGFPLPTYAKVGDAGMDLRSVSKHIIGPGETKIVDTGLRVEIPYGYEIQVRPRSGLSYKTKLRIANSLGTIDHSYRGSIGVIIENIGNSNEVIEVGDRVAQAVLAIVPRIEWVPVTEVTDLSATDRGEGGFGSTGKQ